MATVASNGSSGHSFGRRRVIRKGTKVLGKVLIKGVSKLARHFSGDLEALEKGAVVIAGLAEAQRSGIPLVTFPPILATLVEPLFQDENYRLQEQSAKAIAIVAAQVSAEICELMVEFPRVLDGLVRLLFRADRYYVQEAGTFALMNLTGGGSESQRKIALYPRALEGLVGLLSEDRSSLVLQYGASMLYLLGLHPGNQKMIVDFPGALDGLICVLFKTEIPLAQARAALALSALACGHEEMKKTIADYPGALIGILKLLDVEEFPEVQECAVVAVANLITADTTSQILEFPNLPLRLITLAEKYDMAAVAIVDLDFYNKKEAAKQKAEYALVLSRRVPELRLLNFPVSDD